MSIGFVTFKDGHVEKIIATEILDDELTIKFVTGTDAYQFVSHWEFNEFHGLYFPAHMFYKYNANEDEWLITNEIEKVTFKEL